ncbi:hypothetical protein ASPWEDRAFT_177057 [Aspergillus wentii DTO 134E9]|uniref:Uncharacterized protein n=1 Tax=Aspergillus wentii DTO 134E9 TaxID=1073089 RepID=A0A1L9R653_ASPWE|nr:uncharacterized protein ASPWEDRAFT_177057 [Aspergillus wentii DTO 134E9]KAI9926927.1 hypothetical protein MW887_004026 [Aspergillus wentii]OJJ30401.1 hypothetical protein ASPWEDRAFT_177057 [Aspergillus wentii DTO 134E9]
MSPVLDKTPNPLWARDAISDLKSAPQTFSSWDSCMAKSYCKWPVIVAIIVGAVIVIAILACVINCLCCGIQCCTGCCRCLSCCCPSGRRRGNKSKYLDEQSPYNNQPYNQPPAPSNNIYQPSPAPPVYRGAQVSRYDSPSTARFDAPSSPAASKVNDDALPAMPSWDDAVTRRVEDKNAHVDEMEMEPLNPSQEPHRMHSGARSNTPAFMGVPPVRTGTSSSYYPESRYDAPSTYGAHTPAPASPGHSPYDNQPYADYNQPPPFHAMSPAMSPAPAAYSPYDPMPSASPAADMSRPVPYCQPSPGSGMPFRQPSPGPNMPLRQPSPGPNFPFRQPSPGPGVPFRQASPGPNAPFRQPSPAGYAQSPIYRGVSPSLPPSSPPPPFTATPSSLDMHVNEPAGRPPSLLQSGRKPATNF